MPRSIYTRGKSPRYLLNRELGGPQGRPVHFGEERNLFSMPGLEP